MKKIILPNVRGDGQGADRAIQELAKHVNELLQSRDVISDDGPERLKELKNLIGKQGQVRIVRIKPGIYSLEVRSKLGWHRARIEDDDGTIIGNLVFK